VSAGSERVSKRRITEAKLKSIGKVTAAKFDEVFKKTRALFID
jgi:hypothetical protein